MDQVDIEALVEWAYRRQCVDRVVRMMSHRSTPPMCSPTDVMVRFAALGVRVDASPSYVSAMGASAQDDAFVIHDAVLALPGEALALVIAHARGGSRPPWHGPDAEALVAQTDRRGRPRMIVDGRQPVACMLRHRVDPVLVAFGREQYGVWWEALATLASNLKGKLVDSDPLPPVAPREPWLLPFSVDKAGVADFAA